MRRSQWSVVRCPLSAERRAARLPRTTVHGPRTPRRGISLLEVLISMFVLLFGLMGVAAIFPVGNHYAGRGDQYTRSAALGEAAFAELKARGMLRPEAWLYAADPTPGNNDEAVPYSDTGANQHNYPLTHPLFLQDRFGPAPGTFNVIDATIGPGRAFVLDPMGAAAGSAAGTANLDVFPLFTFNDAAPAGNPNIGMPPAWQAPPGAYPEQSWPVRRLTVPGPDPTGAFNFLALPPNVAETIFRLRDDVVVELPEEGDRPGIMRWRAADVDAAGNPNNTPELLADDTLLARAYSGNYSWLATIVPSAGTPVEALQSNHFWHSTAQYDVSVAVFYKRVVEPSAASERAIAAALLPGGRELVMYAPNNTVDAVDAALEDIRSGQWIALAGVHPTTGQFLLKWYRLLSLDEETTRDTSIDGTTDADLAVRRAMLDGPEWPTPAGMTFAPDLRAILLPGVIGVSTQTLPMAAE